MTRGLVLLAALAALVAGASAFAAKPKAPKPPAGAALEALAKPPVRAALASQRIYFVMTDRYANGTTDNDTGGISGGKSVNGFDPADTGYYHGGDFRGLTGDCTGPSGLARIKQLGFNSIWVTPPFGQRWVQGDSAAYHGYWIRDFTHVDPHLGTDADFAAFVDCAHGLGLKVILDVVVNHTADYILLPSSSTYSDALFRDCRGRKFNPAAYVRGPFPCLDAGHMPKIPTLFGAADRTAKSPPWLNDVTNYHNRGDISFGSCTEQCFEQGDFFGLDDLFTEKPVVWQGLADVYGDWIKRFKVDGFRIDTARHVNSAFFGLWLPRIQAAAKAAGVKDFQAFGEVAVNDSVELSNFVRRRGLPNVLDFPMQEALTRFASGQSGPRGIASRLADDDYFQKNGVEPIPPTFLGNHDMGRAAQQIKSKAGTGISADEWLKRDLLAHDLLYLLRGAPVVYYGDEVGMAGSGGDKAARQDMFPTQVSDWKTEERVGSPPVGIGSSFAQVLHPVAQRLRTLGKLRDDVPALATGASIVRYTQGSVLAVSRIDAADRREYLAVVNAGTTAATVQIPTSTPSAAWTALLGTVSASSSASGTVAVTVPPLSSLLLKAGAQLAGAAVAPKVRIARDQLTDLWQLSAGSTAPVSVAFAIHRAKGAWNRVGVDDSPPYRAFLNGLSFKPKEKVYVVAIVRGLDGTTTVSPVASFIPRQK